MRTPISQFVHLFSLPVRFILRYLNRAELDQLPGISAVQDRARRKQRSIQSRRPPFHRLE